MRKRMVLMLAGMVTFLAVLGTVKYQQVQAAIAQGAAFQPPPEAVTTIVARRAEWPATLPAIGTVVAVHGVTVSADLPGVVERIAFDSGRTVREGEVLVELDTRQERAQLAAALAGRELAALNLERIGGLFAKGVTSPAEHDRAAAEAKQRAAEVEAIRAAIARKTIRAPFAGLLGIRQVNLGQYLAGGDPVVSLQSLHPIHVDFAVPQQEVGRLSPGAEVRVAIEGEPEAAAVAGEVTAVDSVVDEATRNLRVRATFDNRDGRLRPGMFVTAEVVRGPARSVVALPASAISYAPYGDSVFVVAELTTPEGRAYTGVRQRFVKLGGARGDQVAVLSGVVPGDLVVSSGVFKLREGAAVVVNNEIQPGNDPAPEPEDS